MRFTCLSISGCAVSRERFLPVNEGSIRESRTLLSGRTRKRSKFMAHRSRFDVGQPLSISHVKMSPRDKPRSSPPGGRFGPSAGSAVPSETPKEELLKPDSNGGSLARGDPAGFAG